LRNPSFLNFFYQFSSASWLPSSGSPRFVLLPDPLGTCFNVSPLLSAPRLAEFSLLFSSFALRLGGFGYYLLIILFPPMLNLYDFLPHALRPLVSDGLPINFPPFFALFFFIFC